MAQQQLFTDNGATVELRTDGGFTYEPQTSWWGEDVFDYTVVDGRGGEAIGSVRVVVNPSAISLDAVATGQGGFALNGENADDQSGISVSGAGDVNGDGLADLIVGAPGADFAESNSGRSYIVFGKVDTDPVLLSAVASGDGGFAVDGEVQQQSMDFSGRSVSGAGDVNGDGLADLIVGAYGAYPSSDSLSGTSYVVFGKVDTDPVLLPSFSGFELEGYANFDSLGFSVSGAGDVNGDGLADLIVGAFGTDPNGFSEAGSSYVVFGKVDGNLVSLWPGASFGGFAVVGEAEGDSSGVSVSGAGDVNGDGLADLVVGAPGADPNGSDSGRSYVVFGKVDTDAVLLSAVAGGDGGFALQGDAANDQSGVSVSGAGDVNGDGLADLIVGARGADPNGLSSGRSYVVFGKVDTDPVLLSAVAIGDGGFQFEGEAEGDLSGVSVSGAGDVNGDGLADLIVGANGRGRSYVVFGKVDTDAVLLSTVATGNGGFALDGEAAGDSSGVSVSGAGDVNGDGLADLIVGASGADLNGSNSGRSYVVFGGDFTLSVDFRGLPADDDFAGSSAAESLVGGSGNDTLAGGGGDDVIYAGPGDDVILVPDAGFFTVDGGSGEDTLRLEGFAVSIDLSAVPELAFQSIEIIDLTGSGANDLVLGYRDIRGLSDTHVLTIDGDDDDDALINLTGGLFSYEGISRGYARYDNGIDEIRIATAIDPTVIGAQ